MDTFKLISDLPTGPSLLAGTELLEIQNGSSAGASQKISVTTLLALALKNLVRTTVKTADYLLAPSDLSIFDTTVASYTALLPNAPTDGTVCAAKMIAQGGTNTVTLTTQGSDTIDVVGGATSVTIALLGQSTIVVYQASTKVWSRVASNYSLTSLDGRYDAVGAAAIAQTNSESYTDAHIGQVSGVNPQVAAYTLLLSDKGKDVQINSASAVNLTIPANSSVAFPLGSLVVISQLGTGVVTILGASGVTVVGAFGVATTAIYDGRIVEKIATDTWRVW